MSYRMLVTTAHPDDESFGPAGTLARYASRGVEIHLICVTNGEASEVDLEELRGLHSHERKQKLAAIRQSELRRAADIIGIAHVDFLNYADGTLCNAFYHEIAAKIMQKIDQFSPQIMLTAEPQGISGHLDHIAVSMITTYAYLNTNKAKKLYYACLPKDVVSKSTPSNYFIYFPPGYDESIITTRINTNQYYDIKLEAMRQHQSQINEVNHLITRLADLPKTDHFILHETCRCETSCPETDLFSGI